MTRVFAIVALLACCVAAGPAAGATRPPKGLWATINICDTSRHPNAIGVRASMPGDGRRTRMYMRFTEQYYSPSEQQWVGIEHTSWQYVGLGIYARRETGRTFEIAPEAGRTYEMRGAVDFRWTMRGHTLRSYHLVTAGGHPGTMGADPPRYSAALCEIS